MDVILTVLVNDSIEMSGHNEYGTFHQTDAFQINEIECPLLLFKLFGNLRT